jgi:hypothetical protein
MQWKPDAEEIRNLLIEYSMGLLTEYHSSFDAQLANPLSHRW